jgi:hemin uptake protein HemP
MNSPENKDRSDSGQDRPAASPAGRTVPIIGDRIESRDLFVGTREIIIGHSGESYRLRLTAQNKLILTK